MELPASAERSKIQAARASARKARAGILTAREQADALRSESTKLRLSQGRPTLLALTFADIAQQLYDSDGVEDVLQRIAEAAVATVAGCGMASVTLLEEGTYRTAASTEPQATAVDEAQYNADEGPALEACSVPLVSAPSFPDERCLVLAARPVEFDVRSAVAFRLTASTT